jgi:TM2 domain-containing membrane protein YozV
LKQYNTAQYGDQKSKIAAGLFGIFLGALGIHNFYLGYTGKAIAQLLITILSFGLLSWVSFTWGLIEGILILAGSINRDKNGVPLKD